MAVSPNAWSRMTTRRRGSAPGARGSARTPSGVKGGTGDRALTRRCYVGRLAWRMRLAIVVPGGVDRSGRERVIPALLWLIERLAARHETHVFALAQEPRPGDWTLRGAALHNLGFAARARWPGEALFAAGRRLAHGLAAHGPFDVVHAFWANNPAFLATRAARALGIPAVVSLAGGELVALPDIGYGGQLHLKERLKTAWALRRAAHVTAASAPMLEAARLSAQ